MVKDAAGDTVVNAAGDIGSVGVGLGGILQQDHFMQLPPQCEQSGEKLCDILGASTTPSIDQRWNFILKGVIFMPPHPILM